MTVELHFNRFGEWPAARRARPTAERAARDALRRPAPSGGSGEGASAGPGGVRSADDVGDGGSGGAGPEGGEVSFTCLAADEIADLNRRYLDRDGPTDVIAFPLSDPDLPPVGDVYLCPEVARESAGERGLPAAEEVVRLVAHGALHVVGHTHPEGEGRETSEMFRLQEEIVRRALRAGPGSRAGGTDGVGEARPEAPGAGEDR